METIQGYSLAQGSNVGVSFARVKSSFYNPFRIFLTEMMKQKLEPFMGILKNTWLTLHKL